MAIAQERVAKPPTVGAIVDIATYNWDGRSATFQTRVLHIVGFDTVKGVWIVNVPANYETEPGPSLQEQVARTVNFPKNVHVAVEKSGNGWRLAQEHDL